MHLCWPGTHEPAHTLVPMQVEECMLMPSGPLPPDSSMSSAAHVAMVMVSLSFPPMPMLMLSDGEEAVGSTHDLLAMAIACV
jgi:hypothetical protein